MTQPSSRPAALIGASVNSAVSMIRAGKLAAAQQMLEALAAHDGPERANAMLHLGSLEARRGNSPVAVRWFEKSLALAPGVGEAHRQLAHSLFILGDFARAADEYGRAAELMPNQPRLVNARARSLFRLKRDDEALEVIRPLLDAPEPFPPSIDIAALIEHRRGNTPKALDMIRKALGPSRLQVEDRVRLSFTAGMLCDALGLYDEAFDHYRVANTYKAKPYNPKAHSRHIDFLIEIFSPEFIRSHRGEGDPTAKPVFVVGMPRSGTTLTEQILSGHPGVAGAGEMAMLWMVAQSLPERLVWPGGFPGCMKVWNAAHAATIGAEYAAQLDEQFPDADRVVDKLPGNYMNLGLIACMLPGAKIIHCVRDPVDTCLSCYFQNFAGNMQPFSCDLGHIAAYYNDYRRLMEHWRGACGIEFIDVRYEDTVRDTGAEARRMIAHMGLPWDDACLAYHESDRVIATASFDQADRPIYDKSVARWRHYEKHLGPLMSALGASADTGAGPKTP